MAEVIDKQIIEDGKAQSASYVEEAKTAVDALATDMNKVVNDIVTKYSDPNTYKTMVTNVLDSALASITSAYTTFSAKVVELYNQVLAQFAKVQAMFPGTGSGIIGKISQIKQIKTVIDFITTKIEAITAIITSITDIINQAIALANDIINTAVNIGYQIVKDVQAEIETVIADVLQAPIAVLETWRARVCDLLYSFWWSTHRTTGKAQ